MFLATTANHHYWDKNQKILSTTHTSLTVHSPKDGYNEQHPKDWILAIEKCLDELPNDQREVVQLSFMQGLSHQEISDKLDIPLGTVKSRLRLSFGKLRTTMGKN